MYKNVAVVTRKNLPSLHAAGIFADVRQYRIGPRIVDVLLVADSFRAGIESFYKAIQQMAIQNYQLKQLEVLL